MVEVKEQLITTAASASASSNAFAANESSFSSLSSYSRALACTPHRLLLRMRKVWTPEEEMTVVRARSGADMQRKLQWYDIGALGIGGMVGAGIFVTTGMVANQVAGPAVILSYAIAGVSALLSAFCYSEFAVEVPAAGGAFSYLRITFGEVAAYLTGANLIMEYVVSNAAVARSFTSYLSTVFGEKIIAAWRIDIHGFNSLDLPAAALVIMITIIICYSTRNSSRINLSMTLLHLALILFVIVAGFYYGSAGNLTKAGESKLAQGFTPFGASGVFNGAAIVYFSYIGYDAVSTMAEEVEDPAKNMPIGIVGSVIFVNILYCLMAAAISMLVPYDKIDPNAPFAKAFKNVVEGWGDWASRIVGSGASLGILSSLLVSMLGQARYLCVIGRSCLIPQCFATVNSSTGTPVNSSIFLGACTAVMALFMDLAVLVDLISIGTLFVYYMVANALLFRRYTGKCRRGGDGRAGRSHGWVLLSLFGISTSAIGFTCVWRLHAHSSDYSWPVVAGLVLFGLAAVAATSTLLWVTMTMTTTTAGGNSHNHSYSNDDNKKKWEAPCMPWLAAGSIFLNVFLMGSLNSQAFLRFGIWSALALVFYALYSVHASHDAEATSTNSTTSTTSTTRKYKGNNNNNNNNNKGGCGNNNNNNNHSCGPSLLEPQAGAVVMNLKGVVAGGEAHQVDYGAHHVVDCGARYVDEEQQQYYYFDSTAAAPPPPLYEKNP